MTELSEAEWRERLTPEQYQVLRDKGTEPAFSGVYWDTKEEGLYRCAACGNALFRSEEKYDAGTGWPSFTEPVAFYALREEVDTSYGMRRIEVLCDNCGSHLGHLFEDGPRPTGQRYCMNSVSLDLEPDD